MRRKGAIETRHHRRLEIIRHKKREEHRRNLLRRYSQTYNRVVEIYEEAKRELAKQGLTSRWELLKRFFSLYLQEWYEDTLRSVREFIEAGRRFADLLGAFRDIIAHRGRVLFTVEYRHFFHRDKTIVQFRDEYLLSLPEDVRNKVVEGIIKAAQGKYTPQEIIQQYPILMWFLHRYVLYYMKYPCKTARFAFKLTPVTIHFFKGYKVTYYVLRWIQVSDLHQDAYLSASRPIDLYFLLQVRKPYYDILNTITYSGEGSNDYKDTVTIARDETRKSLVSMPLRRAILQPHWIKRAFAKVIGKPEAYDTTSHCSIFAIPTRRPKAAKYYEAGIPVRIFSRRGRRHIKERTYYDGLRV